MPLTTFSADATARASEVNANFALCVLTDTARTMLVPVTVQSSSATALTVGLNGATNPAFQVDASTALSATGLKVTSSAANGDVYLTVISSVAGETLRVNAKGSGLIVLNDVGTGEVQAGSDLRVYRKGAVTTGFLMLGSTGTNYLGFDGTNFQLNGNAQVGATLGAGATPATSGKGITFHATVSNSSDANTLDDYDEHPSGAAAACTGAITANSTWKVTKVGNVVTLVLPALSATASAATSFSYGTVLPAKYRPASDTSGAIIIADNGAQQVGALYIASATGVISIYKNPTFTGNFTAAAGAGLGQGAAFSWTL